MMSKINFCRVTLGGLAAGLVYNLINWLAHGVLFKAVSGEAMAELNMTPLGALEVLQLRLIWMIYGLTLAWLVAAIRPRFGPGLYTALRAATVVWLAGIVVPALPNAVLGFASMPMILVDLLVGLLGLAAGGVAADCLYKGES